MTPIRNLMPVLAIAALALPLAGCVSSDDLLRVSLELGQVVERLDHISKAIESQAVVTQQGIDLRVCDDLLQKVKLQYPGASSVDETVPYAIEGVMNGYPEERGHF